MIKNTYSIVYRFDFEDKKTTEFIIEIDSDTMQNTADLPEKKPFWTELKYQKCSCCPLEEKDHSHCPIALNIVGLIDTFKDHVSSDKCVITCITPERAYVKETTLQTGLFSILGIINATSKCPIMGFFKPMAKFHLPFSNVLETKVKVISFYLLSEYFKQKKNKHLDIDMKKLDEYYLKVQEVDSGILRRINDISQNDADKNALIILNSLAQLISWEIEENLQSIENIFNLDPGLQASHNWSNT